ncbi:MAG: precorrin-6Y C5,15-methyltransferase (decarboxylating) subunit CbiT [Acidimicrobiia bacterium]|nr:precorrin-6Y C5,15-methyltransferase (decarboxylating) subunit CbiT [Acidimicrobiia bacterium]
MTVGDLASVASGTHPHRAVLVIAELEPVVAPAARLGGLPVGAFAHRAGMITKPEVRSVVLGKLDLPATGVLWDLGAGSGSVAVEASLAAPGLRVIAVERNGADADRAVANAAALGATVEVVVATAPDALADLPDPDRVFVGGGGLEVLEAAWARLRPGGRLVATFAAVDRAAAAHRLLGSLVQVSVDRADTLPDGGVRFAADNPVFVAWGDKPHGDTDEARGPASEASTATAVVDPRPNSGVQVGSCWWSSTTDPIGTIAVGVGCSSDATADEVAAVVADALGSAPSNTMPPAVVATVDRRRDHPAILALTGLHRSGRGGPLPVMAFPSSLLAQVSVATPSAVVADAVGTPSVAEAAALLAAGPGARLVVTKRKGATATAAVAVGFRSCGVGRLTVVGLGPGAAQHRTPAAVAAVRSAEAVVGYGPYVDAVADLVHPAQRIVRSAMGTESDRADAAVALAAAGWRVAIVSSGDAGVFGMASTVLEAATAMVGTDGQPLLVDVVPGVTAAHAGAAAVGAPLAGAHAAITLSDILVPWERIEAQLRAAAGSGLALALYNPRSKGRPDHLGRARAILADVLSPDTPVAVVTAAGDHGQQIDVATLATLDPTVASMHSVVLVGTVDTRVDPTGRLVTSRHHPSGSGRSVTSVAGDTSDGSPAADAIDPGPSAPPLPAPPPQEGARP